MHMLVFAKDLVFICMHTVRAHEHIIPCAHVHVYVWVCVHVSISGRRGGGGGLVWRQGEPIDQPARGAAYSSRSSCPLGVKDTDVTALITGRKPALQTFTAAAQPDSAVLNPSSSSHFTLLIPPEWAVFQVSCLNEILSTQSQVKGDPALTCRM